MVAIPTLLGVVRVARSAEKLLDTLNRELPPTLHSLRQTGVDLGELANDLNEGVQNAGHVVKQVDRSLSDVHQQARQVQITTRGVWKGVRVAWQTLMQPPRSKRRQRPPTRRLPTRTQQPQKPAASHSTLDQAPVAELPLPESPDAGLGESVSPKYQSQHPSQYPSPRQSLD